MHEQAGAARKQPGRRGRWLLVLGVFAALLANYWALETVLASHAEPARSWISDLGARTESTAWRFDLLNALSGVVLAVFAFRLRPSLGRISPGARLGLAALMVAGACAVIDAALPLDCARSLDRSCHPSHGLTYFLHGAESVVAILTVGASMVLIGGAMRGRPGMRREALTAATLALAWLLVNLILGAWYLGLDLDESKGLVQRAGQLVLGLWVLVLALAAGREERDRSYLA